ncbi:MAG: hypothetical protein HKN43_00765 [Rhodothermales bacterium]|nr:hypothetical protein [Rhodothermales bacterium]
MNQLHYSSRDLADEKPANIHMAPAGPFIVIGFDGSIKDISPAIRNVVSGSSIPAVNFFSLIHRNHLYPVMRDVADFVCRGKRNAQWLLRLKTAGGAWKFFKAEARRSALNQETITLLLRSV